MAKNYHPNIIIGFRSGGHLLCRTCFESKGLNRFDSLIRDGDLDSIWGDCDSCHILLFEWSAVQDFIKEGEGWRRIRLKEGGAPFSMLATGRVQTARMNEEADRKGIELTRLILAAARRRWIKKSSTHQP